MLVKAQKLKNNIDINFNKMYKDTFKVVRKVNEMRGGVVYGII